VTGILIVDKPAGMTSFGVVAKLRGMAKTKKVGHAGTLDPAATGVLPVFLGGATRFIDFLPDHGKRYAAHLQLGITTDTQDTTGRVLETRPVNVTAADVTAALPRFEGKIMQTPPMYSALKKDGKRLYELARQGVEVEREAREVEVHTVCLSWNDADETAGRYQWDIECSKGAYIRTLCHDLGAALGCGGAMAHLRRTGACGYTLGDAHTLEDLQALTDAGRLGSALLPLESAFVAFPRLELDERQAKLFTNGTCPGRDVFGHLNAACGERIAIFGPAGFLGLATPDGERLKHLRVVGS